MIATAGTTTPVAALSFVVNSEEVIPVAEPIVGLEELSSEVGEETVRGS